jgi:hypothetical protein
MATKQTKGPGRPKEEIDYALVARYAQAQCTQEMIAASLHCSLSKCTHDAEFQRVYFEAKEEGKQAILMGQYNLAMKGNADMLKWLGKQYVKQADKVDTTCDSRVTIVIEGDDKDV